MRRADSLVFLLSFVAVCNNSGEGWAFCVRPDCLELPASCCHPAWNKTGRRLPCCSWLFGSALMVSVTDEATPEAGVPIAEAHLAEGGPVHFVGRFVTAWAEGRHDDARASLDPDSPIHPAAVGDPLASGINFVPADDWKVWGIPEVLDNGDEIVTFVKDHVGQVGHVAASALKRSTAVQFVVRRRDDAWSIVQIVRYGT